MSLLSFPRTLQLDQIKKGLASKNNIAIFWRLVYAFLQQTGAIMMSWYEKSREELILKLGSNTGAGLKPNSIPARQRKYGKNQFKEPEPDSLFIMALRHMKNMATIILIIAAVLSLLMGIFYDGDLVKFFVILGIIILNVTLAVTQERGAENALAALKKLSSPSSLVLRGGRRLEIPSSELVPGDILLLRTGDMI